jgi:adenylate cyclase
MLVANFLANFIGVFFVQTMVFKSETPVPTDILYNPLIYWTDRIFTPSAFVFVFLATLWYERPIRRLLQAKSQEAPVPHALAAEARRRLLNEPFVLIAFDFSMWFLAAILYSILFLAIKAEAVYVQRALNISLGIGIITVTVAFFLLEHVLQKRMVPYFFPNGGLYATPGTLRIRLRVRLAALLVACNLIPLFSIINIFIRITKVHEDPNIALEQLRSAIITNALVFAGIGICLTMLFTRNLTVPLHEIAVALRRVRNGIFDKRVKVTSNDEIGYTGDVINEMTEGLQERELIKDAFGKYVAKEVRDEVLSGRIPLDGEKKDVTVLFADLRDFTPMTEKSDPKMVVRIMNSYFQEMADAIQNHGGLVLQFVGDEIYAVFGAPINREDHPARAFQAGLEMGRRLEDLNERFEKDGWPRLRHGIGIHSGEALAANIGSQDRLSYLLVGDTVNLASRLQSLTKEIDTELIVSASTHARLKESELRGTDLKELPPRRVKGRSLPVAFFALA